jgi:lysophospholipase L1-like esterase
MNSQQNDLRVAFLGDSISEVGRSIRWHGGASSPENHWSNLAKNQIQKETGRVVCVGHFGIGGQNTYEGLGRLDSLESFSPDLVVVAFGANDCCHHFLVPEETKLALTSMVSEIRERFAADVMIVGTAGDNPLKPFFRHLEDTLAAQKEAAQESSVPFVDVRNAMLAATNGGSLWGDYHLAHDNCHPNDLGHHVWAGALAPILKRWVETRTPA